VRFFKFSVGFIVGYVAGALTCLGLIITVMDMIASMP